MAKKKTKRASKKKPLKIRIAVSYDKDGFWAAAGCSGDSEKAAMGYAKDMTDSPSREVWVEVELPIIEDVIEGEVVE